MARIIDTGIAAEPNKPIAAEHCRSALAKWNARVKGRPNYRPDRPTAIVLDTPACEHRCATCYMECAIAPDRLAWWVKELALAEVYEAAANRQHGVALPVDLGGERNHA